MEQKKIDRINELAKLAKIRARGREKRRIYLPSLRSSLHRVSLVLLPFSSIT